VVSTVIQCQMPIWVVRNHIESNLHFLFWSEIILTVFFWLTTKYKVSNKAFVCFKYIPIERWWRTIVILCELNFELPSFSIYYKINVLPVRNVIACSTWPICKIKRLNKENNVSNFAIFIKCTCKCVSIN
jgi:hypothetical protein